MADHTLNHYRANVSRIIDGDTIDVMIDCGFSMWTKQRLRLLDIDTPERGEPGYADAKARLAKLFELAMDWSSVEPDKVAWQPLIVHTIKRDSFGRWLATVWTEGSEKSINQSMVEFGYEYKVRQAVADSGEYPAGKIKAIKIYRELTGGSLIDAKKYVEGLYE